MKKEVKKILVIGILSVFAIGGLFAQDAQHREKRQENRKKFIASLDQDQKKSWEAMKESRETHKIAFQKTFSEEQRAIIEDKVHRGKGKRKKLRDLYTEDQKEMMKAHREQQRSQKDEFKKSLTEEQTSLYNKLHMKKRKGKGKGGKRKYKNKNKN